MSASSVSAAWDTGTTGAAAMKGLVGANNSAALMALANAQAAKMKRTVQVAMLRSMEAQGIVEFLRTDAETLPDPLGNSVSMPGRPSRGLPTMKPGLPTMKPGQPPLWQIANGVGFGLADPSVSISMGDPEMTALFKSAVNKAAGGLAGGAAWPPVDLYGYRIHNELEQVVWSAQEAVQRVAVLADRISRASKAANSASRLAAEALNYPGMPAESVPTWSLPQPPKVKRPTQVAPLFLDFLYSKGRSDPYVQPRESGGRRFVHNPLEPAQRAPEFHIADDETNVAEGRIITPLFRR